MPAAPQISKPYAAPDQTTQYSARMLQGVRFVGQGANQGIRQLAQVHSRRQSYFDLDIFVNRLIRFVQHVCLSDLVTYRRQTLEG